jgi:hypothetical protein
MLFHLKIKITAIFSTRRQLLLCVARRHVCFVLKQSVTVTSLNLNCFKLIGWFNHHNVFPPIRSVFYRFLHCDYRKYHCDYKKLHCVWLQKIALWLQKIALLFGINCTEINQSQSSNILRYIIISQTNVKETCLSCALVHILTLPVDHLMVCYHQLRAIPTNDWGNNSSK